MSAPTDPAAPSPSSSTSGRGGGARRRKVDPRSLHAARPSLAPIDDMYAQPDSGVPPIPARCRCERIVYLFPRRGWSSVQDGWLQHDCEPA